MGQAVPIHFMYYIINTNYTKDLFCLIAYSLFLCIPDVGTIFSNILFVYSLFLPLCIE